MSDGMWFLKRLVVTNVKAKINGVHSVMGWCKLETFNNVSDLKATHKTPMTEMPLISVFRGCVEVRIFYFELLGDGIPTLGFLYWDRITVLLSVTRKSTKWQVWPKDRCDIFGILLLSAKLEYCGRHNFTMAQSSYILLMRIEGNISSLFHRDRLINIWWITNQARCIINILGNFMLLHILSLYSFHILLNWRSPQHASCGNQQALH